MARTERTDQGEQYLLPGTERRTLPGLPYAAEPNGQLALHFFDPQDGVPAVDAAGKDERRTPPSLPEGQVAFFPQVTLEAAEALRAFLTAGR
ncbi:hypothetical protein [Azospirillum sp. SYSU D00513]|uniref:hypothetical protein n=1 Tax=Azospirillum sp. SYSU D00513 TaxID=2812561 RepID=UPI001A968426|nr:hypothetical protein [Azospirillum sp. SYSU D00513]